MEAAVRFELTPIKARGFADRGLKPLDYAAILMVGHRGVEPRTIQL